MNFYSYRFSYDTPDKERSIDYKNFFASSEESASMFAADYEADLKSKRNTNIKYCYLGEFKGYW